MDRITPEARTRNMTAIRSKDMKPEMAVRRLVYGMGYRYRLHRKKLPGKPDLVFPGRRSVIFVHGCFWHQHGNESCRIARMPKSNTEYWIPKLERNVERDRDNLVTLRENGWKVLVIWECEMDDIEALERRVREFLDA